ncbi:hypothetical protein [Alteriqipengyuania sp. 357]
MSKVDAAACQWREEGGGEAAAARCLAFLEEVGIEVDWFSGDGQKQPLDGLAIVNGRLLVDPETPIWPGDLLHEGGHIAGAAPEDRPSLGPVEADPAAEMMAIAWSYAASLQCGITPEQLFHDGGYRGDAPNLRSSFLVGPGIGTPMLALYGMTAEPHRAQEQGMAPFPAMARWLR